MVGFDQRYNWHKSFLGKSEGSYGDLTISLANYVKDNNLFVRKEGSSYVRIDNYISGITGLKENNLIKFNYLSNYIVPMIIGGKRKKVYAFSGIYKIKTTYGTYK